MTDNNWKINYWLLPLAWLYGWGVSLRNKLFDWGWLRSKSFNVPVICIGNLAVGGTGKTPHTEYLIRLLQQEGLKVATLSRGYKRKSKGFVLADKKSTARQIGDEPCQMKQKFPEVQVAVDANRCNGIEQLLRQDTPSVEVILLDDAYQHRYVTAGLNILLTDYNRLFCDDKLLPAGRLREAERGKLRAQVVIVTKCPDNLKPIDFKLISKQLELYPYQQLYFSRFKYGRLYPLFASECSEESFNKHFTLTSDTEVLLVTGIASPTPMLQELKRYTPHVTLLAYGDHHDFQAKELAYVKEQFHKLTPERRIMVTTEKDAARLKAHPALSESLKQHLYVLPIEIEILQNQQDTFNQNIINYVRTNSRDSSISERENAHKA
ncbi:MAG: tetraacyldisaccharide 4'-kinase [Bacteroides sp.]|nr:tetraacyldisaccharide 4'-kinase [Bacteroides sp.]